MTKSCKIYVGYDSREDIAWQVCRHSLLRHASRDIEIHPLKQAPLRELGLYNRPVDAMASTEFSLTRFLVPYLGAHDGWTMFVDCDFLYTRDVYELFDGLDETKAVHVVQHDYTPSKTRKMDNKTQTVYPRKNWSSMIVFNGAADCVRALTPGVVNTATPAWLHRFSWVPDDALIGSVPLAWNFLEGEYPKPDEVPAAIHYTNGGPWFEDWKNVDFGDLWLAEEKLYLEKARQAAE
jgi:hypothetical protein